MSGELQAVVVGVVGRDAEIKTVGQDAVMEVSVATSRKVKGEEVTTWVRVSMWGKRGEAVAKYLTKGTRVSAGGPLTVRQYTAKSGEAGVSVEVRADWLALQGGSDAPARRQPGDDEIPF